MISTQVLQEFYVAATRKLAMPPLAAKTVLAQFEAVVRALNAQTCRHIRRRRSDRGREAIQYCAAALMGHRVQNIRQRRAHLLHDIGRQLPGARMRQAKLASSHGQTLRSERMRMRRAPEGEREGLVEVRIDRRHHHIVGGGEAHQLGCR